MATFFIFESFWFHIKISEDFPITFSIQDNQSFFLAIPSGVTPAMQLWGLLKVVVDGELIREKELKTIALIDMAEDSLTTELMPAATAALWKICELMESSTLRGDNWR
jgi:hypothetical protein